MFCYRQISNTKAEKKKQNLHADRIWLSPYIEYLNKYLDHFSKHQILVAEQLECSTTKGV